MPHPASFPIVDALLTPACGSPDTLSATLRLPDRTLALSRVSAAMVRAIAAQV